MKKNIFILIAVVTVSASSIAQTGFVELGGPGLASINFDTRFSKKSDGIGGRVGIGGFSFRESFTDTRAGVVFLPVGLNYIFSKNNRNYFEIGAGVTPVFGTGDLSSDFSETFGHLILGYRMQPEEGGFTFRAFVCPIFGNGVFIPYYGGISFGYKFGGGKEK